MINELKALKYYFTEQWRHYALLRNKFVNDETMFAHYKSIANQYKNLWKSINEFLNYIQGWDKK